MGHGIVVTIGVILVLSSRVLYTLHDGTLAGNKANDSKLTMAIIADILGTVLTVMSLLDYNIGVLG